MPRRTEKQKQRKNDLENRVLGLARERFFAVGFSAVTMDELAGDLGISKKTLYQLFPEKKVLLERVLEGFMAESKELVTKIADEQEIGMAQRLGRLLTLIAERLGEIKLPFIRDLKRHAPDVFSRVEKFREKVLLETFRRLHREGIRQGVIRRDISEVFVHEVLLALVNNIANPDKLTKMQLPPAAAIEGICRIVFEGVLNEKGRKLYAAK